MKKYYRKTISHSGILGMKWGVRNYQYPDGTLTPEGKLRYRQDPKTGKYKRLSGKEKKYVKAQYNKQKEIQNELNKPLRQRKVEYMSDQELSMYNNRMQAESNAHRLRNEVSKYNQPQKTGVQKFTEKVVKEVIEPAVINAGKSFVEQEIKNLMKDKK